MKIKTLYHISLEFIRKHFSQYLIMTIVIGIFCGSFALLQIIQSCIDYTKKEIRLDTFGHFSGIIVDIPKDQIGQDSIKNEDSGTIRIYGSIPSPTYGRAVVLGEIDQDASKILNIELKEGRFPINDDEIALMYEDYLRLDQIVSVGDKVTYQIETEDGIIKEQSFTLCGIVYDYSEKWNNAFSSIDSALLPTALTNSINDPLAQVIVLGESYLSSSSQIPANWFGGQYYQNYFLMNEDALDSESNSALRIAINICRILLIILLYIGCRSVTAAFYRLHSRSVKLLNAVGMKTISVFWVYWIIGLHITVISILFGLLFGGVFSLLTVFLLKKSGANILYHFALSDYTSAALIVLILLFAIFSFQILSQLKRPKHNNVYTNRTRLTSVNYRSYFHLYKQTIGKNKNKAMRFQTVLLSLITCIFLSANYFSAIFTESYLSDVSEESELIDADFAFLPMGGKYFPEYLNLEEVRDYGLTKEQVEEINSNKYSEAAFTLTGDYASSFLHFDNRKNDYSNFENIYNRYSYRNEIMDQPELNADKILETYGLSDSEDLIDYPIYGIPAEQLSLFLSNGMNENFDKDGFDRGETAIAYQHEGKEIVFQEGDEIEIYIYEFDPDLKNNINFSPRLTGRKMKIQAIYNIGDNDNLMDQYLSRVSRSSGGILISDQLMLSADRELRYSTVLINLTDKNSDSNSVEKELLNIYESCRHGRYAFRNYVDIAEQFKANVKRYKAPFICLLYILLAILLVSYSFSSFIICVMNARTDYLLLAIGINIRKQRFISLFNDLLRSLLSLVIGVLVFIVILLISSLFLQISIRYIYLLAAIIKGVLFICIISLILAGLGDMIYCNRNSRKEVIEGIQQE